MIARATLPFTLRHILDRVGLASMQQLSGPFGALRLNRLQGFFAWLGDWSSGSDLARRSATLSGDRPERLRRFCPDCGEDTAHEGFDEFGAGSHSGRSLRLASLERNGPARPRRPGRRRAVYDSSAEAVMAVEGCDGHQAAASIGVIWTANPRLRRRSMRRWTCLAWARLSK